MLTIGQVAERSGVPHTALRFYEDRGLITSVRTAQRVGLTLEDVHDALAQLPDNRTPTKSDWERLSRSWKTELDARIDALYRLRDRLTGCIGCGCLSLRSCALQNIDDEQAENGPGAPRLKPALEGGTL